MVACSSPAFSRALPSFISEGPGKGSHPQLPDSAQLWLPQESLVVEAAGGDECVWTSFTRSSSGSGYFSGFPSRAPRMSLSREPSSSEEFLTSAREGGQSYSPAQHGSCSHEGPHFPLRLCHLSISCSLHWPSLLCSRSRHPPASTLASLSLLMLFLLLSELNCKALRWADWRDSLVWVEFLSIHLVWFGLGWIVLVELDLWHVMGLSWWLRR